jgi:hypothetical protein
MTALLKTKQVKVRFPVKCGGCGNLIKKGEDAEYTSYRIDRQFKAKYICTICKQSSEMQIV